MSGWDDPRMPTLVGLRRRGFTPESIRDFAARIGVAKRENMVDVALLEDAVRDDLNRRARRAMAVLRPLRVVIENYPEGQVEVIEVPVNPEDPSMGTRTVPFSKVLYIEQDDFREDAAAEVLPAVAGPRGAAARHVLPEVRARGEGRARRGGRAALHLRSGHPRRFVARRPEGEGHDPLGVGGARGGRRGQALRPAVHGARPPRRRGRARLEVVSQPALAGGAAGAARSSPAWRTRRRSQRSSSSAWATTAWIPTPRPASSCSTERCRFATPGRGSLRDSRQLAAGKRVGGLEPGRNAGRRRPESPRASHERGDSRTSRTSSRSGRSTRARSSAASTCGWTTWRSSGSGANRRGNSRASCRSWTVAWSACSR